MHLSRKGKIEADYTPHPFGYLATYFKGVHKFGLTEHSTDKFQNKSGLKKIGTKGNMIHSLVEDKNQNVYYISHSDKKVVKIEHKTGNEYSICSLLVDDCRNGSSLGKARKGLAINAGLDILYVKKSEFHVSVFYLGKGNGEAIQLIFREK